MWTYHNSFIIADSKEAYVLETADKWWVVEKVRDIRSISNSLSIRGMGDTRRSGILQHAIENGYCKDDDHFDFASAFSQEPIPDIFSPLSRPGKTQQLLKKHKGRISSALMMDFLREHEAGICMHGGFESVGSEVSLLNKNPIKSIHWFTGSTNPCRSVFKPFAFPSEGFKVMKPGPYDKVDPKWFWTRHTISKKRNIKKLKEIENSINNKVNKILAEESKISDKIFLDNIKKINVEVWEQSEVIIK